MKNVFVGNLSFSTGESKLQELFEWFGEIMRVHIITDGPLNGREVDAQALNVNEVRPEGESSGVGRDFSSGRERSQGRGRW
jgi:RNA recognition motif-containing protein